MASATTIYRGSTIEFSTTFYDLDGAVTQPSAAEINIVYPTPTQGETGEATLDMTAPGDPEADPKWTAVWDTRNVGPGVVFWSIHTIEAGVPFSVEDGRFTIAANDANLATF